MHQLEMNVKLNEPMNMYTEYMYTSMWSTGQCSIVVNMLYTYMYTACLRPTVFYNISRMSAYDELPLVQSVYDPLEPTQSLRQLYFL